MALANPDLQALAALFGASGQYDWSNLLGQVTLDKPAAGQPTQGADALAGYFGGTGPFAGQPTVAATTEAGYFGNGGPFAGQPTATQQGLLGEAQQPTLLGDQGQRYNQNVIEEAKRIDVAPSQLAAFNSRWGRAPTSYGELGQYLDTVNIPHPGFSSDDTNSLTSRGGGDSLSNFRQTEAGRQFDVNSILNAMKLVGSLRGPQNAFAQQDVLHGLNAGGVPNSIGALMGKLQFTAPMSIGGQ